MNVCLLLNNWKALRFSECHVAKTVDALQAEAA
jgi:hypothetical protein